MRRRGQPFAVVYGAESLSFEASLGVRTISERSCSHSQQIRLYSQDHSTWDRKQLVVVGAAGSAPIPRGSICVYSKYEREGTKSKTDLFHWNDAISSWIEGVKIL